MEKYSREFQIQKNDIGNAGTVASLTKRELKRRGLKGDFIKTVTIGIYEAEINVVIHSYGGNCVVNIDDDSVDVTFEDIGPGIECIDAALTPGFSTASHYAIENGFGAGMGLPNIQSVSDEMELTSSTKGTRLYMKFNICGDCYES